MLSFRVRVIELKKDFVTNRFGVTAIGIDNKISGLSVEGVSHLHELLNSFLWVRGL